jgi:hypothetical protein
MNFPGQVPNLSTRQVSRDKISEELNPRNMKTRKTFIWAAIGMALLASSARAQHSHLEAGAISQTQNAQLIWVNGADFVDSSGYVNTLSHSNSGRFAGFYNGNITLTALPATSPNGGPAIGAAALGSTLKFKVACLEGPPGGSFGFWDVGSVAPSLSLSPGETDLTLWNLSQNDGSPGTDPYGHIHGRRFSATKAGIYKVGFTAVDTSTNGLSGGPIHTPSAQIPVYFEAGVNIRFIEPDEDHTHVSFAAPANFSWQVQASLAATNLSIWLPVGAPVVGDDYFHQITDSTPVQGNRFYRLLGTPIVP